MMNLYYPFLERTYYISIIVNEPVEIYLVNELLATLPINFQIIDNASDIRPYDDLVISTKKSLDNSFDFLKSKIIFLDLNNDFIFLMKIVMSLHKISTIKTCVIGVDPGRTIGIALCVNGIPIIGKIVKGTFEGINVIKNIMKNLYLISTHINCIINVGAGGQVYKSRILYSLQRNGLIDRVRIVQENKTTPHNHNFPSKIKHIYAASLIAQRNGRPISKSDFILNFRKTDLREIQNFSRIISGNITISLKLARQVALDEISIYEAIEQMKKKKNYML